MSIWTAFKQGLRKFAEDEAGLSATEYAVLFVVILAAIVLGAGALSTSISNLFQDAAGEVDGVGP